MTNYSDQQLEDKIHAFIDSKMDKFPELQRERYYIVSAPETKSDRVNRGNVFSFFHLERPVLT